MKNNIKRLIALLTVIVLLLCVGVTLYFAVTGNGNFLGMLLLTLMVPILLWVYLFFYRFLRDRRK